MILPPPARYFPIRGGRYDVAPALRPLGTPFGNGEADRLVFQLDDRFSEYRANKLACRSAAPGRHRYAGDLEPEAAGHAAAFLGRQLAREHPAWFSLAESPDGARLECRLTRETLYFDPGMKLARVEGEVAYTEALDALCSQFQEDLAIVRAEPGRGDWLAAYQICAPTHWAPEAKAGKSFVAIHTPVPGIEPISRVAGSLVDAMIHRGPFVRFVWGLDTDRRPNRHPVPPPGEELDWPSPPFDPSQPSPFVFRVERQVMVGLPEARAALFFIRLYLTEGAEVRADPERRRALVSALRGMSPESRAYKGIAAYADALIEWLDRGE
jgi:hypothetical protein